MNHLTKRPRAYVLVLVMTIGIVVSIAIGTMLIYIASANRTTGRIRANRACFYAVDGAARDVSRLLVEDLASAGGAVKADTLEAGLTSATRGGPGLSNILPDGFHATDVDVSNVGGEVKSGVSSGLFEEIIGSRREFGFGLQVASERVGVGGLPTVCESSQAVEMMRLPITHVALYGAMSLEVRPPTGRAFRVPGNGGQSRDVTAAAYVDGDLCGTADATFTRTLVTGRVRGCDGAEPLFRRCADGSCIGESRSLATATTTLQTWLKARPPLLADGGDTVPRLLGSFSAPAARVGRAADGSDVDNGGTLRFMLDTPRAAEDAAVRRQRIASAADIRIIDGVWFFRDPSNPEAWPGIKISSDHLGAALRASDASVEAAAVVGDIDLAGTGNTDVPWSYYTSSSERAVVSYGALVAVDEGGRRLWRPGYRPADIDPACTKNTLVQYTIKDPCLTEDNVTDRLLAASGVGFHDVQRSTHGRRRGGGALDSRILPINLDLDALVDALPRLSPRLASSSALTVFVTSTWPGSLRADSESDLPAVAPARRADGHVVPAWPLCGLAPPPAAGVADCRDVGVAAPLHPNALRVLPVQATPTGRDARQITVATDLPLYVVSDTNNRVARARGLEFIADSITLVPANLSDDEIGWHTSGVVADTDVVPFFLHGSFLTGYVPSGGGVYGGGVERALRSLAPRARVVLQGSLSLPWVSVWSGSGARNASDTTGVSLEWAALGGVFGGATTSALTPRLLMFAPGVSVPDRRLLCSQGGICAGYGYGYGAGVP